ncbi:MAG: MFS transporter [Sphingomicrobium sp.]
MAATPPDTAISQAAMRKASWRILPLLGLGYLFSFLDRLNVSFAATQMNLDLGFSATVYGLGGGLFFLTYGLLEVPSGMIMPRFGARRWIARIMISWGLISAAMMFIRSPLQFYALRLLLGAAEAGFWPTAIYFISSWFPGAHRGRALSRFYCFGGVASILMGVMSGWLLGLDGLAGLRGWQWLFLAEGLPAVFVGLAVLLFLPEAPAAARWLTEPERGWITAELAAENARHGAAADHHVLRALKDPMVLKLALIGCLTIGSYVGFLLIAPQVLMTGTGMNATDVGYIVSVGGALSVLGMLASGWHSDRLGQRFTHLLGSMMFVAACFLVMAQATTPAMVLTGYLAMAFVWPAVTLSTCLVLTEVVPFRMVAVAMAAVNTLSQLGAFAVPALWGMSKDSTGSFHLGMMLVPVAFVVATAIGLMLLVEVRAKKLHTTPVLAPA